MSGHQTRAEVCGHLDFADEVFAGLCGRCLADYDEGLRIDALIAQRAAEEPPDDMEAVA